MRRFTRLSLAPPGGALAASFALAGATAGQERERTDIPDQYKWDLTDLYPSEAVWRKAKEEVEARLPGIRQFAGKLDSSAGTLEQALEAMSGIGRELSRLYAYASQRADEDTRQSKGQAMTQEMTRLASAFAAEAAFVEPEVLRMSRERIEAFIRERPGLKPYDHYLYDILRRQPHTGTEAEERLIAQAAVLASTPSDIYGIFSDADFPYPSVTLADGKTVRLNASAYHLYRAHPNRDDRQKVMSSFFGALGEYRRTLGATMNASVQRDLFYMKARKYSSSLQAALNEDNIPVAVYHSLVEGVNANLPTFHRYLGLRKRMMGVEQLHYCDLYAPLVGSVDIDYPMEEAREEIVAALKPLGASYTAVLERAFRDRWIDLYPSPGKRSGAYSNSTYDVHPYMLLNYNNKYTDMSTLAHELGHTMHSFLSNRTQPYPKADYPIFLAEV
ncbi:MAG: oligoendopeptidase F, partial [Acidobacteria bacterium]